MFADASVFVGEVFRRKGMKVEYELGFYTKNGMDDIGVHVRNFDLLKLFPNLTFLRCSSLKAKLYSLVYDYMGNYPNSSDTKWVELLPPRILSGYYADPDYLYYPLFQEVFSNINSENILDAKNQRIYSAIEGEDSVAIHVRRGDLSEYNFAYGYPVTVQYFIKAVEFMQKKIENPKFYIFSDDKEYVEQELIPIFPSKVIYEIVQNGSDKGYMDLLLISKCKHQITSKGSLGKYGALLNMVEGKIVIVSKDDKQTFMFDNAPCIKISI